MPGRENKETGKFPAKNQDCISSTCLRQARGWVGTARCKNSGASETPTFPIDQLSVHSQRGLSRKSGTCPLAHVLDSVKNQEESSLRGGREPQGHLSSSSLTCKIHPRWVQICLGHLTFYFLPLRPFGMRLQPQNTSVVEHLRFMTSELKWCD